MDNLIQTNKVEKQPFEKKTSTPNIKRKGSILATLEEQYKQFQEVQSAPSKFKGKNVKGNLLKDYNNQPKEMICEFCEKGVDKMIYNSHLETHPSKITDRIFLGSYNNALNREVTFI